MVSHFDALLDDSDLDVKRTVLEVIARNKSMQINPYIIEHVKNISEIND